MTTTRRRPPVRLPVAAAIALGATVAVVPPVPSVAGEPPSPPVTGCDVPELAVLDELMIDFMTARDIGGGTLAVMRDGQVVYQRGFGWRDAARTEPMPPDAMMRLASVSKPITAAAIRELIDDGLLTLDTPAFEVGQGGGVLELEPFPSLGDLRLANVTIHHLLDHRGGWDRDIAGDLTYREVVAAGDMGIPSPPGREATVRWILGQPLQHAPGTEYAYSNIGFLVLGLVVEELAGMPLLEFVHERVLGPLGVPETELIAGRTFAADHDPREPFYEAPGAWQNVFDPDGPPVSPPYGGWDHEARVGQGGQVATTRTLLAFLEARYVSGPSVGLPRSGTEGPGWRRNMTGSLPGTNALARQRGDGVNYAVILNARPGSGSSYAAQLRTLVDDVLDAGGIVWPDGPVGLCDRPADVDGDGAVGIADLLAVLSAWGPCGAEPPCGADVDGDGTVALADVLVVLGDWDG